MTAADAGFDSNRLDRLRDVIRDDVDAMRYDGCVLLVAREGRLVVHEAFGFADRATGRSAELSDVFFSMSIAKQLTNTMVMMRVERGEIAVTTRVAEILPAFGQKGKHNVTIGDLIVHRAGLPFGLPAIAPEQLGNIDAMAEVACALLPEGVPGQRVNYSALIAHSVLAAIVRRLDGGRRSYRQMMAEDLFGPLGMTDTSLGLRADLAARKVPVIARDRSPDMFDPDLLEGAAAMIAEDFELPAGGCLTTAHDFFRFAECFRRGGEIDGIRILSPSTIGLMTTNQTGDLPNGLWDYARASFGWPLFPACLGYGFFVRGQGAWFPTPFGLTASPSAYGGFGAGSNCFWVDPEKGLVCVFLSAGLMAETKSTLRHQKIADLVHAALVR
ncbi:MAG TPA: serine hydrolase domain-containing protein [Candidatus Binatia bacterium]|jgi:CubicO group peptidase (beta-lactamase class C family)